MLTKFRRRFRPKLVDILYPSPAFPMRDATMSEGYSHQSSAYRSVLANLSLTQYPLLEQVRNLSDEMAAQLPTLYRGQGAALLAELKYTLRLLDDQWQHIVQSYIDPLFGSERSRHFADLGIGLSPAEKEMNRRLLLAVGNIGIALVAEHLFLPLALINIGFSAWLIKPIAERGYHTLVNQKRLTYPLVVISTELVTYLHGFFVPGSVVIFMVTLTNKDRKSVV